MIGSKRVERGVTLEVRKSVATSIYEGICYADSLVLCEVNRSGGKRH